MTMAGELSKRLFEVPELVHKIWEKIPKIEILNQETTINVPESVVEYSMFIRIPSDFRSIRKPIEISAPSITRISTSSLHPFPQTIRDAVRKGIYDDGRVVYALIPELLPPECDLISMTVWYSIAEASILDDLVDRKKAHEPSGPERNEYWMSAKLKHPKALIEHAHFGRFDLRDVDVTVDVGIHNELKTTIPSALIQRMKAFFDLMAETDPRQQFKALPKLRQLAQSGTAGREFKVLVDLESLFFPEEFSKYVDVIKDFRYSSCYKGKEFFELPIPIIPKKMNVISRADLTLEKPAAEGILVYKSSMFVDAIKGIIC
jgi:hypothetical protein